MALLDDEVISFNVLDVTTGQTFVATVSWETMTFQHANEYEAKLKEQFVVVQPNERKQMIVDQANALAAEKIGS